MVLDGRLTVLESLKRVSSYLSNSKFAKPSQADELPLRFGNMDLVGIQYYYVMNLFNEF